MSGFLYDVGASATCSHAGQVTATPGSLRVKLGGLSATTIVDTFTVAACPFNVSSKPQPCVLIKWLAPAKRIKIEGNPAILRTSSGICQSAEQAPQGSPIIVSTQMRVKGL